MTSQSDDFAAKAFKTNPTKANLCIYRNDVFGAALKMPVTVNGTYGETDGAPSVRSAEIVKPAKMTHAHVNVPAMVGESGHFEIAPNQVSDQTQLSTAGP